MKRLVTVFLFVLGFGLPMVGMAQVNPTNMGGGGKQVGAVTFANNNGADIPVNLLHYILTEAAPHFNQNAQQFIRRYYTCGCITVEQIGPNRYLVTYGNIGIEILVDASGQGVPYFNLLKGRN